MIMRRWLESFSSQLAMLLSASRGKECSSSYDAIAAATESQDVFWTVFALSRGKPEQHLGLHDCCR